jgi:hypothetical protein
MDIKSFYLSPQTDVVLLENEGILCASDKYSTTGFEWDEAMDL